MLGVLIAGLFGIIGRSFRVVMVCLIRNVLLFLCLRKFQGKQGLLVRIRLQGKLFLI